MAPAQFGQTEEMMAKKGSEAQGEEQKNAHLSEKEKLPRLLVYPAVRIVLLLHVFGTKVSVHISDRF